MSLNSAWYSIHRNLRNTVLERIIYDCQGENNRVTINHRSFIGGVFAAANIPSFYRKEVVLWTIIKIYPIG